MLFIVTHQRMASMHILPWSVLDRNSRHLIQSTEQPSSCNYNYSAVQYARTCMKKFLLLLIFSVSAYWTQQGKCVPKCFTLCVCVFFWLTIRYTWSDKNIIFGARYENGNAHNEYFVCFMKYSGYNKRARVLELYFWSVFPFVLYI